MPKMTKYLCPRLHPLNLTPEATVASLVRHIPSIGLAIHWMAGKPRKTYGINRQISLIKAVQ